MVQYIIINYIICILLLLLCMTNVIYTIFFHEDNYKLIFGFLLDIVSLMYIINMFYDNKRLQLLSYGSIIIFLLIGALKNMFYYTYYLYVFVLTLLSGIKILIIYFFYNKKFKNIDNKYNIIECPICYEPFKPNDYVVVLDCDHIFCKECNKQWNSINKQCPICRRNVNIV